MESELNLPNTGGFLSTDLIIVLVVAVIFFIGYFLFVILRENLKTDDMKEFKEDDFISEDDEKQ